MLADRALPPESGMKSIRLLQRNDGDRQVLLSAANYGRLATLMHTAFSNCNLTITNEGLSQVLRQGVNLIGAGLLDMIKKRSGLPDNASVLGFVGMLLARAQGAKRGSACAGGLGGWQDRAPLVEAGTDGWRQALRPDRGSPSGRRVVPVDLYRSQDDRRSGVARRDRAGRPAADQIEQTAAVLANAFGGAGPFAAPRSEMLKEVLVRAASNRWGADEDDVAQRKIWGRCSRICSATVLNRR